MAKIYYWRDVVGDLEPFVKYMTQIEQLLAGDYKALHLERLQGSKKYPAYSIRVNSERGTRLLFTVVDGKICMLEVILGHDYHKSRFLRRGGLLSEALEDEAKATTVAEIEGIVPDSKDTTATEVIPIEFHQQKIICFNSDQEKAIATALPAIVYGQAGSGKTCVALSILSNYVREHRHNNEALPIIYVSQSPPLIKEMRGAWRASTSGDAALEAAVVFKTYEELLEDELLGTGLRCADDTALFNDWCAAQSKKSATKPLLRLSAQEVWQEFRIRSGYSAKGYLELGARQSAMNQEDRETISHLYDAYIAYLLSKNSLSPELHSLTGRQRRYPFVVVDEAQDFSFGALSGLKTLANQDSVVFFLGDHQVLFDGKSRFSYIKSMLANFETGRKIPVVELPGTYRCSAAVIELTNRLIDLKYRVTGGVADKVESTKMTVAEAASHRAGRSTIVNLSDKTALDALKEAAKRPNLAVVTFPEYVDEAKIILETELVFTPKQAKGLEYAKVVVWRPLDCDDCSKACVKLGEAAREENAPTLFRAKNGHGDELLLPYFNEIITAITRAQDEVVVVQNTDYKIQRMYDAFNPAARPILASQPAVRPLSRLEQLTTEAEWVAEVKKLLEHGLDEQALNIYTKTLKHSIAEFDAFNISFRKQQAPTQPLQTPASAVKPAPVTEKKMGIQPPVSASASKKQAFMVDARIQKNVTTLISDFNQKRLSAILAVFDMNAVLLCPIEPGKNLSLIEHILLATENTTTLIRCILNSYEPTLSQPLLNIIKSANRRLPVTERGAISELMLIIEMLSTNTTQSHHGKLTPAQVAAVNGRDDAILLLHKYKVDLNKQSKFSSATEAQMDATPAFIAAQMGHAAIIKALHKCGADLNKTMLDGATPACIAAEMGHTAIIKALHECGADLDQPMPSCGFTPAFIAAQNGHANVIATLHQCKADLDQPALDGATPAYIAAEMGHTAIIKALHECGADLNKPMPSGATPACIAAENGDANVIKALHQCEAKLNQPRSDGATPACIAAQNGHANVITTLHQCGADLNKPMFNGATPACIAAQKGHENVITTLRECGADLSQKMLDASKPAPLATQSSVVPEHQGFFKQTAQEKTVRNPVGSLVFSKPK